MKIKFIILLALAFIASSANAEQVEINADDNFILVADYLKGSSSSGVLMLHQCNADRQMYKLLAKTLKAKGIHSLALDFRSYGDSVSEDYSRELLKKKVSTREEYYAESRKIRDQHWEKDTKVAYEFLKQKVGSDNISFIGASCGGVQSIYLAEKVKPKSFTFFSSGMNEEVIKRFIKQSGIPAFIIAAQGDKYTYNSSKIIYEKSESEETRLLLYKGRGHGYPLFKQDPKLIETMVEWFEASLKE